MKKNDIYNGWKVIDITPVQEFKSTGIWLKHEKTGMELFHLLNDDEENLFSFSFKTLPFDSKGTAHIMEHSVLCGSKNFPLKDPFIRLNNQSIKTFLNAMTFPDKTVYPASSNVEKDYFNLMAVYGDAVFFPLLKPEIFLQEAHRVEVDEENNLSIQGVVYNEMKGSYSSFESVVGDMSIRTLLAGTAYEHDSGGDPECIPDLTYNEFIEFHKTYYSFANCRLFLYGNISTEKQIDFINEKFLTSLDCCDINDELLNQTKEITSEKKYLSKKETPNEVLELFNEPRVVEVAGPSSVETDDDEIEKESTVTLSWVTGVTTDPESFMESVLLGEILMGHDGSPLSKALLESDLGEDIAPNSGLESELKYLMFSAGLRGVKRENASKVQSLILSVLESLYKNGISQDDIDSAVMTVDFSDREIRRSHGPYSIVLMRRCLRGWLNGVSPVTTLQNRAAFNLIKEKIKKDSNYFTNLIKKLLLSNNQRTLLTVFPSEDYNKTIESNYKKRLDKIKENISLEEIKELQNSLKKFQQTPDSQETLELMPHLKPSELKDDIDVIETDEIKMGNVPVFVQNQPVNGITYVTVGIPVDTLDPELFPYLPFLSIALTNVGFNGMSWSDASVKIAKTTGGFGASLFTSSLHEQALNELGLSDFSGAELQKKTYEISNVLGRHWLFVRMKTLEEKTDEAVNLLFDCIENPNFNDTKRLSDLLIEHKNDIVSSIVPSGNDYALGIAAAKMSRSKAIDEIWNGLTQLYNIQKLVKEKPDAIAKKLTLIHKKLLKSGMTVNLVATEEDMPKLINSVNKRVVSYVEPQEPFFVDDEKLYSLTLTKFSPNEIQWFDAKSQVGFAATVCPCSPYGTKLSVYETLVTHWVSNNLFWEKIRTVGGAYGAFAFTDANEKVFSMATFRDPDPYQSLKAFFECFKEASEKTFSQVELEKIVTGCYSKTVQPRTPSSKGFAAFVRKLYGITDSQRKEKMQVLLSSSTENIHEAALSLYEKMDKQNSAVIYNKKTNFTGKIASLPL